MFTLYQEYLRTELVTFVGSKQNQSGIIWGSLLPNCVIVTSGGKHGDTAGYTDRKLSDGSWSYVGQGSSGDQTPDNFANDLLIQGNRDILLFTTREPTAKEYKARGTRSKFYKYEGLFKVGSWKFVIPDKGKRAGDKLIEFHLLPVHNIYTSENTGSALERENDYSDLSPATRLALVEFRKRSGLVKSHALRRANGICEHCEKGAPFMTFNNIPFLEVHHIFSLADDGPDEPQNVAAVCPNCHRRLHFGMGALELNKALHAKIAVKELTE